MASDVENHLSAEELSYLRELFSESRPGPDRPVGERGLLLDPSSADAEVLMQLIGADRLQMTAEQGGYLFRFDLQLERPPSGFPVALRFSYPTIVERSGTERAARVRSSLEGVDVSDPQGRLHHPRVRDISASGMALEDESSGLTRSGRHRLNLRLRLAEAGALDVQGRIVRVERGGSTEGRSTIGIQFEDTDPQTRAVLNRFVFQHHPLMQR